MTHCLLCGQNVRKFLSFGRQPLANGFLAKSDFGKEYFFDLEVCFCAGCGNVQLAEQPDPKAMFNENYAFFSGTSKGMTAHFKEFAEEMQRSYLPKDAFVVEIGSNDGIFLRNFAERGVKHLGVEPSANVAEAARKSGIETLGAFFDEKTAAKIVAEKGHADGIFAANCFCHIASFDSVVAGIGKLLKPDGIVAFEDPYLGDVLEKTSYDQIYDEHVFLFSAGSVGTVFAKHGFELVDCVPQSTHGGSMRYLLARRGARPVSDRVAARRKHEASLGLTRAETYEAFKKACEKSRDELVTVLKRAKAEKKRVVGYAATSKSTTVLNYAGIGPDLIEFISDTTPLKQGKFSPGMHIPVLPYERFKEKYPDYALLFGWNHRTEILAKEGDFTARGGRWIGYAAPSGDLLMILCANPKAQYLAHQKEIDAAIRGVLEGGNYIHGENCEAFEREFAAWLGVPFAIGCANGTDALRLALSAFHVGAGSEVIVPSHTAVATVAAIELAGAKPVFVDIEADSFTLDPEAVRAAITVRTRAVVAVHLYGHPASLDRLATICKKHGLTLVEDCAQAHGATLSGRKVGTWGDIAAFSFYPTKNLGALGDGGLVATASPDAARRCRQLREYGWEEKFVSTIPGFNSRLDEVQAAVLRVKLKHLDADNEKRRGWAKRYAELLAELPLRLPRTRQDAMHVFHHFVVRLADRNSVRDRLHKAGVAAGVHYPVPVHQQPAYRDRFGEATLPVTERAAGEILSLPMYPELGEAALVTVTDAVRGLFGAERKKAS